MNQVQQKDLSDEAIARAVCVKVGDSPGVSYSDIAAKAYECGRTELAIKLLDFEARSGEQVPLLLKMKRSQLALSKAVESGDTDLGEPPPTTHTPPHRLEGRLSLLQSAVDEYNKAKNEFAAKATEDEMRLLRFNASWTTRRGQGYWDCLYRYTRGRGYPDCTGSWELL
ncbi:hypothetical protein INR49_020981 [Caranx melampygus]|nr:hypothetical protein INR49_020981 [Caranx melampygus]